MHLAVLTFTQQVKVGTPSYLQSPLHVGSTQTGLKCTVQFPDKEKFLHNQKGTEISKLK